ncbi:MAG: exodeoxyribonuclease VII large subunit [Bacteroidales bacterium]|nr:exodeoxyribonuclease VII large subunit [Bacteroidales bacterium]
MQRQRTIMRLKEEGMFEMNSTLELPALPSKIAIISSENAAGYRDFIKHLHNNEYGFNFQTQLFSSLMQGATAPQEIISSLEKIAERADEFDLVVIVRGGGSVQDLSCFDDYELAANIAQFPIPVLTGIGHDHDFHIADMVAFQGLKTPTATADFIIEIFASEEQHLSYILQRLNLAIRNRSADELAVIDRIESKVHSRAIERISKEGYKVELLVQRIKSGNPLTLLDKGYAVPLLNGKRIKSVESLAEGGDLILIMADGKIECKVEKISKI